MEENNDTIYEITEATETPAEAPGQLPQEEAPRKEASHERETVSDGSYAPPETTPVDPRESELEALLKEMKAEEILGLIKKGRSYDEDVAMAEVRGETAGRNAKIEQLLDNVAADRHPDRGLSSGLPVGKSINSIFDLADLA